MRAIVTATCVALLLCCQITSECSAQTRSRFRPFLTTTPPADDDSGGEVGAGVNDPINPPTPATPAPANGSVPAGAAAAAAPSKLTVIRKKALDNAEKLMKEIDPSFKTLDELLKTKVAAPGPQEPAKPPVKKPAKPPKTKADERVKKLKDKITKILKDAEPYLKLFGLSLGNLVQIESAVQQHEIADIETARKKLNEALDEIKAAILKKQKEDKIEKAVSKQRALDEALKKNDAVRKKVEDFLDEQQAEKAKLDQQKSAADLEVNRLKSQ